MCWDASSQPYWTAHMSRTTRRRRGRTATWKRRRASRKRRAEMRWTTRRRAVRKRRGRVSRKRAAEMGRTTRRRGRRNTDSTSTPDRIKNITSEHTT